MWYKEAKRNIMERVANLLVPFVFQTLLDMKDKPMTSRGVENWTLVGKLVPPDLLQGLECLQRLLVAIIPDKPNLNYVYANGMFQPYEHNLVLIVYLPQNFNETMYSEFYRQVQEVMRHELEHVSQMCLKAHQLSGQEINQYKSIQGGTWNLGLVEKYLLSSLEVEAQVVGMYYGAKKNRIHITELIAQRLETWRQKMLRDFGQKHGPRIETILKKLLRAYEKVARERYPALFGNRG